MGFLGILLHLWLLVLVRISQVYVLKIKQLVSSGVVLGVLGYLLVLR
jgi:hypothetical protein